MGRVAIVTGGASGIGRAKIAYMIATLTAVEASFVNGAVIVVDGGMTAQAN
jgi:NAD(P)-dependent dehydrogenase (short-subunit alcohol dehydrogenase family)